MDRKSIWEGTDPSFKTYPQLNGIATTDVVIVGGGISGITAAYLLSKAGKNVVVLEAHRVGLGTTGNSTGNLYATVDEHLSSIESKWNTDVMKEIVASRTEAIGFIEAMAGKHQLDCDFVRTSFHYYTEKGDKQAADFIEKEFKAMKRAGLDVALEPATVKPFKFEGALELKNQAQFHPLKYVRGICEQLGSICTIYENSAVTEVDEKTATVKTAHGQVNAKHIIMATHSPKGLYLVHTVLGAYREFGVAAELKNSDMQDGIYWSIENPKHSLRICSAGGKKYLMVVGDKFKTGQHHDTVEYIKNLDTYLRERFDIGPPEFVWAGQQYKPADGLPYMGKSSDTLSYLTGFATDGLVYGTLGAMIISDQLLGKKNRWEKLYDPNRHTPLKSAADFVKENANNAAQYVDLLPGKVDVENLTEVPAGEGKILEIEGKKVAVYRDENNQCQVVSAICTHLFCVVQWNGSEKSWDCPCHGSRFKTNGEIIEGPAIKALPRKDL